MYVCMYVFAYHGINHSGEEDAGEGPIHRSCRRSDGADYRADQSAYRMYVCMHVLTSTKYLSIRKYSDGTLYIHTEIQTFMNTCACLYIHTYKH